MVRPQAHKAWNSRPRIMASAMSVTANSSKHSSLRFTRRVPRRPGAIGSSPLTLSDLSFLPPGENAPVNLGHEGVEMDPVLLLDLDELEEQVHQHGLAAPDRPPDIEAPRRRLAGVARAEQPAERAGFFRQPALVQAKAQGVEFPDHRRLRAVAFDPSLRDKLTIFDR